jgi:F0F1-type ATP synthase gamma subunit
LNKLKQVFKKTQKTNLSKEFTNLGRTPSKKNVQKTIQTAMTKWNDPKSDTLTLLNEKVDNVKVNKNNFT